jgi:hypothetical protein
MGPGNNGIRETAGAEYSGCALNFSDEFQRVGSFAIARGPLAGAGSVFGIGHGANRLEAQQDALFKCSQRTTEMCSVLFSIPPSEN